MGQEQFSAQSILDNLKNFQKRTAQFVFNRLYKDENSTKRFLIADEVGLGKTHVARGIIAQTIEFLKKQNKERINIVYICSNTVIASQNIRRITPHNDANLVHTRLTYLAEKSDQDRRDSDVNFITLTTGTAFDQISRRDGHQHERAIIFRMLIEDEKFREELRETPLRNLLQATVGKENWKNLTKSLTFDQIDQKIAKAFCSAIKRNPKLRKELNDACEKHSIYQEHPSFEKREQRQNVIKQLRETLAQVSVRELKPDLVILDEFQRFKDLLDAEGKFSDLVNEIFNYRDVRVLLLSATPYKMYTLDHEVESGEDNHYKDFFQTLNFLFKSDQEKISKIKDLLRKYKDEMINTNHLLSSNNTKELENILLEVMCRTERVGITQNNNSMVVDIPQKIQLQKEDLQQAAFIDELARNIHARDILEYWKSIPYLINFLKGYNFRDKLDNYLSDARTKEFKSSQEFLSNIWQKRNVENQSILLTNDLIQRYKPINPGTSKMRRLFEDTIEKEMWQLLWMPPSMPYIKPSGPYKDKSDFTKSLIFSSWNAVPSAIATLCSYEAERRMMEQYVESERKRNRRIKSRRKQKKLQQKQKRIKIAYKDFNQDSGPLLRFEKQNDKNALSGMHVLSWILPFPSLAQIDPLSIALKHKEGPIDLEVMKKDILSQCSKLLKNLPEGANTSRIDNRWYWAVPFLIEQNNSSFQNWCNNPNGLISFGDEKDTPQAFKDYVPLIKKINVHNFLKELGKKPNDLEDVLCDFILAAPGICALRSLSRITDIYSNDEISHVSYYSALKISMGFRSLFNAPEVIALVRGSDSSDEHYWRRTLTYAIDGNIQSVLDEYIHVLKDSLGFYGDFSVDEKKITEHPFYQIAQHIYNVLSIRTTNIQIDEIEKRSGVIKFKEKNNLSIRCNFAQRFSSSNDIDDKTSERITLVKNAFNSPFRPFILASTSIGQEGLDFHLWCHSIIHWNLPSNPVDIEQREGRVHRYKGHAVRKNIAQKYGMSALSNYKNEDPWTILFDLADKNAKKENQPDLIPYWIFEEGNGEQEPSKIQRKVPLLKNSKDLDKFERLKKGLATYRLALGQPRQEDFVSQLQEKNLDKNKDLMKYLISLQPKDS